MVKNNQSSKNGAKKTATCLVCDKKFEYYPSMQKGIYCSVTCRYQDHSNIIKKSYTPKLRQLKSELATRQMQDQKQIELRQKSGKYPKTAEQIEKIKESLTKDSFIIAKKIIIKERGKFCQRCGEPVDGFDLIVHHLDGRKWNNDTSNLIILCRPDHSKIHNEVGKTSGHFAGLATVENYIAKILKSLGVNLDEPDFKETPLRVARMYQELFEGNKPKAKQEIEAIFKSKFPCDNDEMIVFTNIKVYSLCPHHLLPVDYSIALAYIPDGSVMGLSKFTRIAELLGRQPILQEQLTVHLANAIYSNLEPKGVAVSIKGRHYCMVMRGVKQDGQEVTTAHLLGAFKEQLATRQEWISFINGKA
jgi:GTP cyclohydrolase I